MAVWLVCKENFNMVGLQRKCQYGWFAKKISIWLVCKENFNLVGLQRTGCCKSWFLSPSLSTNPPWSLWCRNSNRINQHTRQWQPYAASPRLFIGFLMEPFLMLDTFQLWCAVRELDDVDEACFDLEAMTCLTSASSFLPSTTCLLVPALSCPPPGSSLTCPRLPCIFTPGLRPTIQACLSTSTIITRQPCLCCDFQFCIF